MTQYIDIIRSDIQRFIFNYLREGALDGLQGNSDVDAYIADIYPYLCTLYLIRRNYPPEAIEEFVRLHKEILSGETRQLKQTLGYFLTDDVNIEQLKSQLEKLQALNSSLTEKVTESDSRIAGLAAEIAKLTAEKVELQRKISEADLYNKTTEAIIDNALGIKLVDMGTSVLWADRNLGASEPQRLGDLYRWGKLDQNTNKKKKYIEGDDIKGNPVYDAARQKLGEGWSIPSSSEWQELFDVCEASEKVIEKNVFRQRHALILTSRKTRNSIIFPQDSNVYWLTSQADTYCLWTSNGCGQYTGYSTQMHRSCNNRVDNYFCRQDLHTMMLRIRPVYTPKRIKK